MYFGEHRNTGSKTTNGSRKLRNTNCRFMHKKPEKLIVIENENENRVSDNENSEKKKWNMNGDKTI